jgi:hypothetical protein
MKSIFALSLLAFAAAELDVAEFQRDVIDPQGQRDLSYGDNCCEWVCPGPRPPSPSPPAYSYRSKGMMGGSKKSGSMGGSKKSGSGSGYGSYYGSYSRRTEEQEEIVDVNDGQNGRELWGKGMPGRCYWDCSGCDYPSYDYPDYPTHPIYPGPGYQCFPTMTSPSACDCTCCGVLPRPEPEPEPEPCYYRSKAMMMGGSYYGSDDCGSYRSKGMMGGSRRTEEATAQQGQRALPGKGWGPGTGWGGPGIMCECDCDEPSYRSKGMMKSGTKKSGKGGMMGGSGSYYY